MRPAIISDLDGTLATLGDRSPFDYQSCHRDEINEPIAEIVRRFSSDHAIILMSGREDTCRELTEKWLQDAGIRFDLLLMRAEDDHRKDSIVKHELYERHVKGRFRVLFVLEDRDQVVD